MSSNRPDKESEEGASPLTIENEFYAGYRIHPEMTLGVATLWDWTPVQGQSFILRNPFAKLAHERIASTKNLNFAADIRVGAPLSSQARDQQMILAVASEQELTYEVPRSHFELGLTTYLQRNFHRQGTEHTEFELELNPSVGYHLLETVSLYCGYEYSLSRENPAELLEKASHHTGSVLQPGVNWKMTRNLEIEPHVDIRLGELSSVERATFGMNLNWTLL